MRRPNRKYGVCFESLEKALAEHSEAYGHLDILCGGWPCQDNSIAGSRKGHKGEKSGLWKEYRRLIELFLPRWIVAENVPGLFSVNAGNDFWQVISDLDSLGYCVAWDVLDSKNFGVAQQRKRVIIVGSLGNIGSGKVLFEQESGSGDIKTDSKIRTVGLCLSTRDGERQNPTAENLVASTITTNDSYRANARTKRNYIAEINSERKGEITGISHELVSPRGVVIGNAVTVNVAKWIGERIIKFDKLL
jgi:DNA (cytosine-5)-methyltransferase 1